VTTVPDWLLPYFHPALVFLGGGTGAVGRYLLGRGLAVADGFPWHTFGINVLGSFLLGALFVLCKDRPGWLVLLGAGFCGGFTTFSTFSFETLRMLELEEYASAGGYVLGSVIAGIAGAWIGVQLARG
jgi:CrcB protein